MAEGKICVCPQCGKKFKLKADFASASFACTQCSATVWVDGKPKGPSGTRRKAAGSRSPQSGRKKTAATRSAGKRSAGGRGSRAASGVGASAGRGRRGRREEPEEQEEQRERGSRYQEKNNSQNVIVAVVGLVLVVGVIAFLLMKGGDDKKTPDDTSAKIDTSLNDVTDDTEGTEAANPPEDEDTSEGTDTPPEDREPAVTETAPDGSGESGVEPKKKLTKSKPKKKKKKKGIRKSRWNPPEDIGHLEDTPADKQKEIDELIKLVFDHWAGRRSLDAKQKLAIIGKPAYLPLLAAIRGAKKSIKWDNNDDDNLVLSSVKLADECLRLMDGYLEANGVSVIRPGTPEKYFDFVVRMHYKRWMKKLVSMDTMPGPFDPSSEYEKETEESE